MSLIKDMADIKLSKKIGVEHHDRTDVKVVFIVKITPELRKLIQNTNSLAKIILPIGFAIVASLHQFQLLPQANSTIDLIVSRLNLPHR